MAFDTSAESWLSQQSSYDLWVTRKEKKGLKIKKLHAV